MNPALARWLWPGLLLCNLLLTAALLWLLQHGSVAASGARGHILLALVPVLTLLVHLLLSGLALRLTGQVPALTRLDWRDLGLTGMNELIVLAGGNWLALWLLQPDAAGAPGLTALPPWLPAFLPEAVGVIGAVLLLDLAAYWLHRASHGWQLLWIFHAWHHTCEELNGVNAFRFHLFDRIKTELPLVALVWLLDLPFVALLWYLSLANAQNINSHSALARHEKMPWQWLLNTPWLHYWHHSFVKAEQKHNYGSILSVWDSLFGTRLDPPLRQLPARLGTGDVQPDGILACLLYPFRRLLAGRDWI